VSKSNSFYCPKCEETLHYNIENTEIPSEWVKNNPCKKCGSTLQPITEENL